MEMEELCVMGHFTSQQCQCHSAATEDMPLHGDKMTSVSVCEVLAFEVKRQKRGKNELNLSDHCQIESRKKKNSFKGLQDMANWKTQRARKSSRS